VLVQGLLAATLLGLFAFFLDGHLHLEALYTLIPGQIHQVLHRALHFLQGGDRELFRHLARLTPIGDLRLHPGRSLQHLQPSNLLHILILRLQFLDLYQ